MFSTRRTRGFTALAGLSAAAFLFSTGTAHAVAPDWKVGGYAPTCGFAFAGNDGGDIVWQYVDSESPTVSLRANKWVAVGNGPDVKRTIATVQAKDRCSGIAGVLVALSENGAGANPVPVPVEPADGDWFDVAAPIAGDIGQDDVGRYTYATVGAIDRFEDFVLSGDHKTLLDSTDRTISGPPNMTGFTATDRYRDTATCIARATTLSVSKNKSSIKKGKAVTVTGSLKVANGVSNVALGGGSVKLQKRVAGTKSWVTVATKTSSASGAVSFTTKPKKSAAFRLTYGGKCAAPWNAPMTSTATGVVKVKR